MTVRRMNHVGVSVRDLDRAVDFYCRWFGFVPGEEFSWDATEEWAAQILALRPSSGRARYVVREDIELELFRFDVPDPGADNQGAPVSRAGYSHLSFEVDNVVELHRRMAEGGIEFHCAPILTPDGVLATYGRDTDGNVFELMQPG